MFTNLPDILDRKKLLKELLHKLLTGAILVSSWVVSPTAASPIAPATDGTGTTVTQEGNQFNINGGQRSGDSANLFHSFQDFGLDANQVANFESNPEIQNILGRVVGGNPSIINGLIQVTGGSSNLFLMNPAGIVFGANAQLNVPADFTATSSTGIGFTNGNYFQAIGESTWAELVGNPANFEFGLVQPGVVANFGSLEVSSGENLSLFGGQVFNAGTLSAPGGNITIASVPGETVLRISQAGNLLSLEITPMEQNYQLLANQLEFNPLRLPDLLTVGQTIDHANKIEQNSDGTIRLTGSGISIDPNSSELTVVSDSLDVSGETGGNVQIFGDKVALIGTTINADGTTGGGNVLVGGELQGQGTSPTASIAFVSDDSSISANGLDQGDGGQIIFWSDRITRFYGDVTATGGVNGGNGGFVEISAHQNVKFRGTVDVSSPQGTSGTILIDPKNITIADGGADAIADNYIFSENAANEVTFDGDDIAGLNGKVILQANNDITVNEEIVSKSVDNLEFWAGRSINVNANIDTSAGNGNIILTGNEQSQSETTEREPGVANIQMAAGTTLNAGNGNIELTLASPEEVGTITVDQLQTTGIVSVNANGGNIRRTNSDSLINARGAAFETNEEGGIGLELEPIRIDVDNLEATTGSGGAFFEFPNGGVTVGGVTDNLTGISSNEGGDVSLSAFGDITVIEDISTNFQTKNRAGNITLLSTAGAIDTTDALLSSTTESGDSGAITLTADGAIAAGTILSRSGFDSTGAEIPGRKGSGGNITLESSNSTIDSSAGILDARSSGGQAGKITLTGRDDIFTGFVLASSQGNSANFSEGGIIEITSSNGSIDTTAGDLSREVQITEDTDLSSTKAIFDLFNSSDLANLESYAVGGTAGNIMLSAYGDITTSYVNSFGKKGAGQISFSSETGSINTANLFSISESDIAGTIDLTTQDGSINTANLFSFSEQGIGGNISLTALGSISTSNISTYGAATSGDVMIDSAANSVNTNEIKTVDDTTNTSGDITINFYEKTGDIQSAALTSVDGVPTITVTNDDGSVIVDSNPPTDIPDGGSTDGESTNGVSIDIQFPPAEEITTETSNQSDGTTDSSNTNTSDSNTSDSNSGQIATTTDPISASTDEGTNISTSDQIDNSVSDLGTTENSTDTTGQSDSNLDPIADNENTDTGAIADSNNVSDVQDPAPTEGSTTTINESNTVVETMTTDNSQTVAVTDTSGQQSVSSSQQTLSSEFTSDYYNYSWILTTPTTSFPQTITSSQQVENSNVTSDRDITVLNIDDFASTNDASVNQISSDSPVTTATVSSENIQNTVDVNQTSEADSVVSDSVSDPPIEINNESTNPISGSADQVSSDPSITPTVETIDQPISEPASNDPVNAENLTDTQETGVPGNASGLNDGSVNDASTDLLDNNTGDQALEVSQENSQTVVDQPNSAAENNETESSSSARLDELSAIADSNNSSETSVNDSQPNHAIEVEPENKIATEVSQENSQTVVVGSDPVSEPPIEINNESTNPISASADQISSDPSITPTVETIDDPISEPASNDLVNAETPTVETIDDPISEPASNDLVNAENLTNTQETGVPVNPSSVLNDVSVNYPSLLDNNSGDEAENNETESASARLDELSAIEDSNNSSETSSELSHSTTVNDSQPNHAIEVEPENKIATEVSEENSQTVVTEIADVSVPAIESSAENISQANSTNQPAESSTESASSAQETSPGTPVPFSEVMALEQRRNEEFEEYFGFDIESQFITAASAIDILGTIENKTNQKSAIVYITANPDQLELIVFTAKGEPILYTVPAAKREVLMETIDKFQLEVTLPLKRKKQDYLPLAKQLYQWLIEPIESALKNEGIDTLLLSMDAGLRSLPIAALHDGNQFLIEKYSLGLIPSVSLMDPRYHSLDQSKVLAMGADTFPDMNSLPAVAVELEFITQKLPGTMLLNEQFTPENLRQFRQQDSYDIVHLATHSDFIPGPIDNNFIYFWNQKLNLDDLRSLGLQNPAAELLVLSACRTAVGDQDAELGFAGLAIRTGVKSVLASLWYVDDLGTLGFMAEFYQNLSSATIKAEALRETQLAMIREEIKLEGNKLLRESQEKKSLNILLPSTLYLQGDTTFSHPYYWAGFTMIGSPW